MSLPNFFSMQVADEMVYETKHAKPNSFLKFVLKMIVKPKVVNEVSYAKSGQTAPAFLIVDQKDFGIEKKRLVDSVTKTQQRGADHFEQKESHSFGKLSKEEWNNMFYKHLNHHLVQFGV